MQRRGVVGTLGQAQTPSPPAISTDTTWRTQPQSRRRRRFVNTAHARCRKRATCAKPVADNVVTDSVLSTYTATHTAKNL